MNKFKIGDVVVLKSGGPQMVIVSIESDGYNCLWFDDIQCLHSGKFIEETLGV